MAGERDDDIRMAAAALYRGCRLPEPAVFVLSESETYLGTVSALAPSRTAILWMCFLSLASSLCMTTLTFAFFEKLVIGSGRPPDMAVLLGEAASTLLVSFSASLLFTGPATNFVFGRLRRSKLGANLSEAYEILSDMQAAGSPSALLGALSAALGDRGNAPAPKGRRLFEESERYLRIGNSAILPSSGDPAVQSVGAGVRLLSRLSRREQDGLPSVLRSAVALAGSCEEAILLDGCVLALSAAAPGPSVTVDAAVSPPRMDMQWLKRAASILGCPLAEGHRAPDKKLLRLCRKMLDAWPLETWEPVLQSVGPGRALALLGLGPSACDSSGELYSVRNRTATAELCLVKVVDPAGGEERWLSVPRYVATPAEGVAWTWGLSERDYGPTLET